MRIVGVKKVPGVELAIQKGGTEISIRWPNGTETEMQHFPLETAEDADIYKGRPLHVARDRAVYRPDRRVS
jgi:hypothetical protein